MKDTTRDHDKADTVSLFFMFVFYRNDPVDPLGPPQVAEGKGHYPRPAKAWLPQAREDLNKEVVGQGHRVGCIKTSKGSSKHLRGGAGLVN